MHMAESANLTASLLVRRAVASETKPAATTADASAAPSPFFAKGDATAKQFRPVPSLLDALPTAAVAANEVAPSPAPAPRLPRRPRLSLRVERALHRRTKLAAPISGKRCRTSCSRPSTRFSRCRRRNVAHLR